MIEIRERRGRGGTDDRDGREIATEDKDGRKMGTDERRR